MSEFNLNPFNFLIIASIFIGATFGLLLIFTKRINRKANILLGLVMFIIIFWNIWVLSLDFQIHHYYPYFYLIPLNYSLALGPLLYFYVKKIVHPNYYLSKKDSIHFLPLFIELSIHVIISRDALVNNVTSVETEMFLTLMPIVQFLAMFSVVSYCIYSLKTIKAYHSWLNKNYSNTDGYSLRWLYRLLIIFATLWFLWTPYTIIDYIFFNFQLNINDYYPIYVTLSIITIWISAEAFLRPEIIFLENIRQMNSEKETPTQEIVKKASWLQKQMETNLFYLNSELTLKSLADNLHIHPNTLSKIINDGLGKSFSNFVNEYRINAFIEKLHSDHYKHITLLGISFECGFNSKTTFNRAFKNFKGTTPLNYKKSIKKDTV